ncbi:MAG: UDP-N-acetylmuramoyl-L-alanine--D-glutamate ligase, partial [Deltaproteobacteria bacterium]|nr:UDP-N-acetylmuramoyl-L-alanine--D-glutamate ligase [Deltaproteobacteria bacterium]
MELVEKKIVVVGLGKTGIAVSRFLKKKGALVVATDTAAEDDLGPSIQQIRAMGIPLGLGRHESKIFAKADLIVLSPGVPHTIEPVIEAKNRGIPVMGEIELASRFIREPIIAVTGTNGKTTTTELIGSMLKRSGIEVFVGGNIGNPLIGYVDGEQKADVVVAEISSFQLDTIESFRPWIGILLNITADHLDRYPNFEAYAASKIRLFENQHAGDIAILNGSDPLVRSLTTGLKSIKLIYPALRDNEAGAVLNGKQIIFRMHQASQPIRGVSIPDCTLRDQTALNVLSLKHTGRHNLENACAAGLAAMTIGAQLRAIQDALDQFQVGPHRLEYVDTIQDIDFFNDSKATNVDAVARAIQNFIQPVVLIMGGLD